MRICLKLVLSLLLLVSLTDLHGQLRYGQIFGLNLSTMSVKIDGKIYNPKISPGIHFGGFLELPVTRNFVFEPALVFSAKGSVYKTDSTEFSISPIYAEVPLILSLSFGWEAVKIKLFAGPYFACGIGGNALETGGAYKNITFGSGKNDDLKRFDIGLNLGAGLNIKGFLICAQYGTGLVNLAPEAKADTEMRNRVIGISFISALENKK